MLGDNEGKTKLSFRGWEGPEGELMWGLFNGKGTTCKSSRLNKSPCQLKVSLLLETGNRPAVLFQVEKRCG